MEYLEEIPLKKEKELRKSLKNNQFQKDYLKDNPIIGANSELEEKNYNNDNIINNNEKNKNIMNTQLFKNTKLFSLTKNRKDIKNKTNLDLKYKEKNLENLISLCKYDIFSYARHGHYKELEKLFLEGISPDSKDKFGNTLLIISAQNNNKRILKICLRYGAQINMQNLMGNSALHFAKEYGYIDIFEYLIKKGADPNIKNLRGIPAKFGLYNTEEDKLFLGEGLSHGNNKNIILQNKYAKYRDNILNEIK